MPDGSTPARPPAENLKLWRKLERTDPAYTKPFTRSGGFKGTDINPTWRMKQMTEAFGPVGDGWGYEQLEWTIHGSMIFILARAWYRNPHTGAVCHTGPQWGGNELVRRRRDGSEDPNDEAFKMAMTDAIGKCFAQLGLAADVYLGQWDDSKYRDENAAYHEAKGDPDTQPAAVAAFEAAVGEALSHVVDLHALDDLWKEGSQRLKIPRVADRLRKIGAVDAAARQRVIDLFSKRKAEIAAADQQQKPARRTAPARQSAPPKLPVLRGDGRNKDDRAEFAREVRAMMAACTTAEEILAKWNACTPAIQVLSKVERSLATELRTEMQNRQRDLADAALDAAQLGDEPPPPSEADYGPSSFT